VVILLLVPLRAIVIPRLPFTDEELAILDGPTASPFVSVVSFLGVSSLMARPNRLWSLSEGPYKRCVAMAIVACDRRRLPSSLCCPCDICELLYMDKIMDLEESRLKSLWPF
jgi:hypothetical protein